MVTQWSPARLQVSLLSRRCGKLTKRIADSALPNVERYTVWDTQLPGFGLRVSPSGKKSFTLRYRPRHRSDLKRYVTLGRYGVITVEEARIEAKRILGQVAGGKDPAREAKSARRDQSVAMAVASFLEEHARVKLKPGTAMSYRYALERHVLPKLGRLKLSEVDRSDLVDLHTSLAAKPYMANYVVTLIGSLYSWAATKGLVDEGQNPARRVERFREKRRERFLNYDEFARLGAALREAETVGIAYDVDESRPTSKHAAKPENRRTVVSAEAVGAIRLLMVTGSRLREILHLRWCEVDLSLGLLLLPDSKTGRKTIVLSAPAIEILSGLGRNGEYVFPGTKEGNPRRDLKRPWAVVTKRADLIGLRLHDLRHSFASVAVGKELRLGLPVLGQLLGHSQASTTARYVHLGDEPLREASEAIAAKITGAMANRLDLTRER
jgi:integrase